VAALALASLLLVYFLFDRLCLTIEYFRPTRPATTKRKQRRGQLATVLSLSRKWNSAPSNAAI
jgi:hypothetical protein